MQWRCSQRNMGKDVLFLLLLCLLRIISSAPLSPSLGASNTLVVTTVSFDAFKSDSIRELMTLRSIRGHGGPLSVSAGVLAVVVIDGDGDVDAASPWDTVVGQSLAMELGSMNVDFVHVTPSPVQSETELLVAARAVPDENIADVSHVVFVRSDVFILQDPLTVTINNNTQACAVAPFEYMSLCTGTGLKSTCERAQQVLLGAEGTARVEGWAQAHQMCSTDILLLEKGTWGELSTEAIRLDRELRALGVGLSNVASPSMGADGEDNVQQLWTIPEALPKMYDQLLLAWSMALLPTQFDVSVLLSGFAQPAWLSTIIAPKGHTGLSTINSTAIVAVSSLNDFTVTFDDENEDCVIFGGVNSGPESHEDLSAQRPTLPFYQSLIASAMASKPYMCGILSEKKRFISSADFLELDAMSNARTGWGVSGRSDFHFRGVYVMNNGESDIGVAPTAPDAVWANVYSAEIALGLPEGMSSFTTIWNKTIKGHFSYVNLVMLPLSERGTEVLLPELLDFFAETKFTGLSKNGIRAPCVVAYSPPSNITGARNVAARFARLGLLELVLPGDATQAVAVGAHCAAFEVRRALKLLPLPLMEVARACIDSESETGTGGVRDIHRCEAAGAAAYKIGDVEATARRVSGALNMHSPSHGVSVVDDALPDSALDMITGRLSQIPAAHVGADSFFLPFKRLVDTDFDERKAARSAVEFSILKYIAPVVLGNLKDAVESGYLGAEWWIQTRAGNMPKEYHLDTAITWCRDNGWPQELLSACHYYPTIGTVMYLGDEGGPTAVFNQSMSSTGVTPTLPREVALVFPKRNRIMAFDGSLYHGVLRDDWVEGSVRATLLVNYWKNKTAGEDMSPTIFTDDLLMHTCCSEPLGEHREARVASPRHVQSPRSFLSDFREWKAQAIPEPLRDVVGSGGDDGFTVLHMGAEDTGPNGEDWDQGGFVRWMDWTVDETTGLVHAESLDVPGVEAWRDSMPGGNPFK